MYEVNEVIKFFKKKEPTLEATVKTIKCWY